MTDKVPLGNTILLPEEHQLLLMALALLASSHPAMTVALRDIARKLDGFDLFEHFLVQWVNA
jgi:hypothetical protein